MYKAIGLFIVLIFSIGVFAPTNAVAVETDFALYSKTCKHYVNRAKFKARNDYPEFLVILADSCQPALASLTARSATERAAAENYLLRLWRFRDTVIDMNMERVFGKKYTRWTPMRSVQDNRVTTIPHVTETGEYLIAQRMGLLRAYRAWLDTGPELALGLSGAAWGDLRGHQPRP